MWRKRMLCHVWAFVILKPWIVAVAGKGRIGGSWKDVL